MKTLLINCKAPDFLDLGIGPNCIPPSLLYVAAALQRIGVEVNILDLNTINRHEKHNKPIAVPESAIFDRIIDFQPSLVGIGCLFSGQFPQVMSYSKKIKEEFQDIPIVIGGIHPTIYPTEILSNCPSIDYVILGEGTESTVKLVDALRKKDFARLRDIDGLAFRQDASVIVNPKTSFVDNLDEVPFPAYELIDFRDYYQDTTDWHNPKHLAINVPIPIIATRGCPRGCNFCSMFLVMGRRWRCRSPQNVVEEIEYLYTKYNHSYFSIMDDNFTLKKSYVLQVCDLIIKKNLNIQFDTPNGIATYSLDEEVIDALVSAGLVRVSLAIESGSDYIRNKVIGKRLSREKIYEIVKITKKYKELYVRAFFIMGMPEETRETLMETYGMIEEIDIDRPMVHNIIPFPGTKLFRQVVRDGLFVGDIDVENIWKFDKFYFNENKQFFLKPYDLELEELQEFREKFDNLIENLIAQKAQGEG